MTRLAEDALRRRQRGGQATVLQTSAQAQPRSGPRRRRHNSPFNRPAVSRIAELAGLTRAVRHEQDATARFVPPASALSAG